jgi:hypothetical protein
MGVWKPILLVTKLNFNIKILKNLNHVEQFI